MQGHCAEGKCGNCLQILLRFPIKGFLSEIPLLSSCLAKEILYRVCVLKLFFRLCKAVIPFCPPPRLKDRGVRSGALAMPSAQELQMNQGSGLPEPLHLAGAEQRE